VYATAAIDKNTGEVILKLVNIATTAIPVSLNLDDVIVSKQDAKLTVLQATDKFAYNTLGKPTAIVPVDKTIPVKNNTVQLVLDPSSLTVIKIGCKKL